MGYAPNNFEDGHIFVDFSKNANVAEDLRLQTVNIENWLRQLEQELTELKSTWEGEDRLAYDEKQKQWDASVEAMKAMLADHSALLDEVSNAFRDNQNKTAMAWQSLSVRA
ncbi:WXG100 family type VII secretion target [Streptomyces sp. NPDC057245]|uniref:WXG100 family type VII secretion target n=1 Tax=Streptomyces TaxID=1883 RepID=UPI001C1E739E|nr:WXG100 family type VII secretion target [Streptomyces sp. A108]MBU6534597.1 WXG100 family type VII secretion target [Streptomyces sp. A108]